MVLRGLVYRYSGDEARGEWPFRQNEAPTNIIASNMTILRVNSGPDEHSERPHVRFVHNRLPVSSDLDVTVRDGRAVAPTDDECRGHPLEAAEVMEV